MYEVFRNVSWPEVLRCASLLNFSTKDGNSFVSYFFGTDKHKSLVLMTNDRGEAREPRWLAGATISPLAPSVVSHLSEHTQMQRHPFKDTDVICGLQIGKPMSLYDYMVTSGGWEKDTTPTHSTPLFQP